MSQSRVPGSFRDPSGFLFVYEGAVHRQINAAFAETYTQFMDSGLYRALVEPGLLVPHEEVDVRLADAPAAFKVIRPLQIPFISYPYEWSFGQLKAAALLTLELQKQALAKGQVLRDASAYNVQFYEGKPVFIDTLSFGAYVEGEPWVAYQQFCKHFLAPLALMACTDVSLGQLFRVYIDGVPLPLASRLLPFGTRIRLGLLTHIHMHAASTRKHADAGAEGSDIKGAVRRGVSKTAILGMIDSLESTVQALDWSPGGTEWGDYYDNTNYTKDSHEHKKELVARMVAEHRPATVWDLGANTGMFSRIAADQGSRVISFDIDAAAVERNWRDVSKRGEKHILPLLQDLTNPSSGIGWDNDERSALAGRGPADMGLALALVHHLAISNNVPLDRVARFFGKLCSMLVIEFVPKEDSQVRRLLATREDVFPDYNVEGFESAFSPVFNIAERIAVRDSERTLFRMVKR